MENIISVSEVRKQLYRLVDEVSKTHQPVFIKGKRNSAVMVSKEDWDNVEETLFVLSNNALAKSLVEGAQEPISDCTTVLDL